MGMVFGTRRRDAQDTDDPNQGRKVPYRLASYEHDHEGKKFKSSNVVYSFWSASKYVLILSLMLWWLPMFGQMIAGYVGGRRAGGPWKGVVASIVPVVCLYAVVSGFEHGLLPSHMFGVAIAPAAIGAALTHSVPLLSPYLQFSSDYVGSFVNALEGVSPYGINTYVLTVAFAYVGGVLAQQNRRELEYTSGAVTTSTTVLVHNPDSFGPEVPEEKPRGTFAGIGALLHLPGHRDHSPESGGFLSRRRDAWANASEMRYEDQEDNYREPRYMLPAAPEYDSQPRRRDHSHHHHSHNSQKRRGAPNYSAKIRFNYPQYQTAPRNDAGYKGGMIRRSKDVPRFRVSSDPRSIKKAQKMIDHEWGRTKRYPQFSPRAEADDGDDYETEAVAVPRRKEHQVTGNQWDSI